MRKYNYITEINYCRECKKELSYLEVYQNWKCPDCGGTLSLKIDIGGEYHSISILRPNELRIGDEVTLDNRYTHRILNIEIIDDKFRIALEKYTTIPFGANDQIAVINGGLPY